MNDDPTDDTTWFMNRYKCSKCGTRWKELCTSPCDDRCFSCETLATPVRSTECELDDLTRRIVVSYDSDEKQVYYDTVLAKNANDAQLYISRIRQDAAVIDSLDLEVMHHLLRHVSGQDADEIAREMQDLGAMHDAQVLIVST